MSENRLQCPECEANLKTPHPVPPGKKIRCPKCKVLFPAPGPPEEDTVLMGVEAVDAPARPRKAKPAPLAEDEAEIEAPEEEEAPVRAKPKKPAANNKRVLVLAGGGAALLLVLGLVYFVFLR